MKQGPLGTKDNPLCAPRPHRQAICQDMSSSLPLHPIRNLLLSCCPALWDSRNLLAAHFIAQGWLRSMNALAKSVHLYTLVNWRTADKDYKGWLCIGPSQVRRRLPKV